MIDEEQDRDETIARVAAALRPLPEVDPAAKAQLLVAVAAARAQAREGGAPRRRLRARIRWLVGATAAALAAAAVFAAFALRQNAPSLPAVDAPRSGVASATIPTPHAAPATTIARPTDVAALQPVQLVLRAAGARHVSVVGDFTDWDVRRAPMTRDRASGLWSVTLALRPGRHVYAFVVDDSVWVRDPRAPVAADADFGRPGSVLLVGRP